MVTNVALNWVLIFGHLGAPAMGVAGAALASSLASWAGFAVCAFVFLRRDPGEPRRRAPLGLRWREFTRMLRFGLPAGGNWFLEFAAFAIFLNVVMRHLGTAALAAINVVIQINSVAFMPAFGVATAGAILVGQTVGAGHKDRVWPIVRLAGGTAMVWMVAMGLVYVVAPDALMRLFAKEDDPAATAGLIAVGATMLAMSAAWQAFDAIAITLSESLRAAGDTAWTLAARIVLAWAVFVPASYVFVMRLDGGPVAAMGCLIGYIGLLAATFAWRFRSGAWKRIELVEPQALPD
jgi:MATE family multidrug resistance protein